MGLIEILVPPFAAFALGILSGIGLKRWEIRHLQPVLAVENIVVTREFGLLTTRGGTGVRLDANRIRVVNTGRTGARDCKVYVEYQRNDVERTGWMLPDNNTAYSLTLSVNIPEYVDLCAISLDATIRIVTNERGFKDGTVDSCRIYQPGDGDIEVTIRVGSSNAKPTERRLTLRSAPIADAQNRNRIVEFAN